MDLLFSSGNQAKVKEVQALLASADVRVLSPSDFNLPADFDVEETGQTFAENAELKAKGFAQEVARVSPERLNQTWFLADDSGVTIDVLGGQPGVHSKRFVAGSDQDRNQAVLEKLATVPAAQRQAHFVAVFCLYQPAQQQTTFFEGVLHGSIAFAQKGAAGFGYDSIFIPEGYTQTFGELGIDLKNTISHRFLATQKLLEFLKRNKKGKK